MAADRGRLQTARHAASEKRHATGHTCKGCGFVNSDLELNEIDVLKRREIEARILAPVLDALGKEFGPSEVLEITRNAIIEVARQQGKELA